MGKRILLIIVSIVISISVMAEDFKEHVVERGETLTSIAAKYGTTEVKLKELNPEIGEMFFTGMIIKVPIGGLINKNASNGEILNTDDITSKEKTENSQRIVLSKKDTSATQGLNLREGQGSVNMLRILIGYNFTSVSNMKKAGGDYSYSSTIPFDVNVIYRHNLKEKIFIEGGLGISYASVSLKNKHPEITGVKKERTYDILTMPISLNGGYCLPLSNGLGLDLYTGPKVGVGISSTTKIDGKKYKSAISTNIGWQLGAALRIENFNIGASYEYTFVGDMKPSGFQENLKRNVIGINIGWNFNL